MLLHDIRSPILIVRSGSPWDYHSQLVGQRTEIRVLKCSGTSQLAAKELCLFALDSGALFEQLSAVQHVDKKAAGRSPFKSP